ncbi:MAG: hypothetical protein ACI9K9_001097, partial [Neolewinella sp.]
MPLLPPKIISVAMLCKGFLAAAGTKTPGQKIWFYSIRVPKMLVALFMPFCESQQQKIKELEDKLAINSSNSSKPPSKDDFK